MSGLHIGVFELETVWRAWYGGLGAPGSSLLLHWVKVHREWGTELLRGQTSSLYFLYHLFYTYIASLIYVYTSDILKHTETSATPLHRRRPLYIIPKDRLHLPWGILLNMCKAVWQWLTEANWFVGAVEVSIIDRVSYYRDGLVWIPIYVGGFAELWGKNFKIVVLDRNRRESESGCLKKTN